MLQLNGVKSTDINVSVHVADMDAGPLTTHTGGTVTLDIRFEIGNGATKLFSESLVFGKGPGQFAVEYPRYRSQKEIEASSFER